MGGNIESYYEAKNMDWIRGYKEGRAKLKAEIEAELSGGVSLVEMILNIQKIIKEVE